MGANLLTLNQGLLHCVESVRSYSTEDVWWRSNSEPSVVCHSSVLTSQVVYKLNKQTRTKYKRYPGCKTFHEYPLYQKKEFLTFRLSLLVTTTTVTSQFLILRVSFCLKNSVPYPPCTSRHDHLESFVTSLFSITNSCNFPSTRPTRWWKM